MKSPQNDDYWRLTDYESEENKRTTKDDILSDLQQKGWKIPASLLKPAVIDLKLRADRGLLPYAYIGSAKEELRKFIRQRRLPEPDHQAKIRDLANVLHAGDDGQTFPIFLDLPPELRERVYEIYIDEFPKVLRCPTQPPLARVSRLMRKEVLLVFYKQATFKLEFINQMKRGDVKTGYLSMMAGSNAWLRAQPNELDGCMRNIVLSSVGRHYDYIDRCIELSISGEKYKVSLAPRSESSTRITNQAKKKAVLCAVLDRICAEYGKRGIGWRVIFALRKAIENDLTADL